MVVQAGLKIAKFSKDVSLEKIFSAIQDSEVNYYANQTFELNVTAEPGPDLDPSWLPTLTAAVGQFTPLERGGFMSLRDLLLLLCIPATVGRSQHMLEMIRTQGIDWPTAFANTSEEKQAESGAGKRTRAYERVKKARQRFISSLQPRPELSWKTDGVFVAEELSPQFVADCVRDALEWIEKGSSPGPLLQALARRLVAEANIADEAALSQAAGLIVREAALRFMAHQACISPELD